MQILKGKKSLLSTLTLPHPALITNQYQQTFLGNQTILPAIVSKEFQFQSSSCLQTTPVINTEMSGAEIPRHLIDRNSPGFYPAFLSDIGYEKTSSLPQMSNSGAGERNISDTHSPMGQESKGCIFKHAKHKNKTVNIYQDYVVLPGTKKTVFSFLNSTMF